MSHTKYLQENKVTALAFSVNSDFCAIATKENHKIRVFKVKTLNNIDSWENLQDLKQHSQTISDIDWSKDNKIITASHDRSALVWRPKGNHIEWEKMLANIDIKLSILVCKWAPNTHKFALGSSCNTLAIGFYSVEEKCWIAEAKRNLTKSPITTLSFHPSSNIIAVGSADFSVTIITTSYKKSANVFAKTSKAEENNYQGPFQNIDSLFETLFSIPCLDGWINHLSFENDGNSLLVIPHTNHIKIFEIKDAQGVVTSEADIKWNGLPFMSGYINKKQEVILGGFNKTVTKFSKKGNYVFDGFYLTNEKTNSVKAKKGIVDHFVGGIEKKESLFGSSPKESEHLNYIQIKNVNDSPVSYDISGVVHFWE